MNDASAYYPPRANWTSALRRHRQRLRNFLERFNRRRSFYPGDLILSAVVPGFAFRAWRPWVGDLAMLSYLVSLLSFFIWLGYPAGDWMVAAMVSIHVTSLAFLIKHWTSESRLRYRMASVVLLLCVLGAFVYMPLGNALDGFIVPLRVGDSVIVTRRAEPRNIQRGDWIAYRVSATFGGFQTERELGGFRVAPGYGLSPVLAVSGDIVKFGEAQFSVNGQMFPALKHMPVSGKFRVRDRQWFVWPSLAISNNRLSERQIASVLQSLTPVTEETFVGRPFKWWFWRKQILDEPL